MKLRDLWKYNPDYHFAHKTPLKLWELEEIMRFNTPIIDLSIDLGRTAASISNIRMRYKKEYKRLGPHDYKYYEIKYIKPYDFKKRCKIKGWDFEDFKETGVIYKIWGGRKLRFCTYKKIK